MPNEKPVAAATSDSSTTNDGYVRLHVSPLDAELLPVVLNSSLLPKARNVSFHTIETFPERRYGFVELPKEDAEKVRKKFNGAVLRGAKMKVDPARSDKNPKPLGEEVTLEDETKKKKPKKSKKSLPRESRETHSSSKKRKREEITGVVLEEGRQVKRGWTSADEPKKERKDKRDKKKDKNDKDKKEKKKDKKKERVRSKYTDHDECLVKTVLPPNKVANAEGVEGLTKKKKKDNKREVVVHEFAKTTKFPTFLKTATTSGSKKTLQFDEDKKCWVDEDGNVVEEVKGTRNPETGLLTLDEKDFPPLEDDDSSSSSDEDEVETRIIKLYHESSSESEDDDDEEDKKEEKKEDSTKDKDGSSSESEEEEKSSGEEEAPKDSATEPTKDESDAETSSDSSDDEDEDAPPAKKAKTSTPPPTSTEKANKATSSPAKNLSIRIPPPATPVITKTEVHPLEALYKKPKVDGEAGATEAQPTTGFSFFGGNNDDIEEEEEETTTRTLLQVPLTPYTEKDFESRGLRSAAPTPDTAHPSRRFKPWEDDNEDHQDEDNEDEDMVDAVATGSTEAGAENGAEATSDFQKWFWEHRGDLNRSWKKRRKLVGKEKRYRENRARMARAI